MRRRAAPAARLGAAAAILLAASMAAPATAQAQQRSIRFYVDSVADSTFVFRVGDVRWIRRGETGVAVDPRERDALVARFRIMDVRGDRATALVTGQTTFLTRDHVALMEEPHRPFWKRSLFWTGSALGAALGVVAGLSF